MNDFSFLEMLPSREREREKRRNQHIDFRNSQCFEKNEKKKFLEITNYNILKNRF